jgi:protocatechuate 3,4-dioxygenase beta subunit
MGTLLLAAWLFQVSQVQSSQAPSVSAAQPEPPQAAKTKEKCSIEGVVVRAATGDPLKKTIVTLRKAEGSDQAKSAITDLNGRFRFKDLEPGRYNLGATRNGYAHQEYGQRTPHGPGTVLTLKPGEEPKDITFRLIPAAAIAGHVYDEDGEPIANAAVTALHFEYEKGERKLIPFGLVQTNDLGEYRLFGLAPGQYYVSASYSPGGNGYSAPEAGYSLVYYPGADDPSHASALDLHGGDEALATDFTLVPVRTFNVRGRVYDAVNARPGVHSEILLMPRDPQVGTWLFSSDTSVQDPQGTFELHGVKPGNYYLVASNNDGGKQYMAREPVSVSDSDVEGVTIVIGRGADLNGRVFVESNAALNLNAINIWLSPRDERVYFGAEAASPKPDATFAIENVPEDKYELQVWGLPEDFYLKAVRSEGESVLESGLEVTRRQPSGPIEVVLSPNGGRIDGLVLKEHKPFTGAAVVLVPAPDLRKQNRLYNSTTTDQNGQFSIRGVAPGDYKLFAWESMAQGAYQDPDFLRLYEDQGRSIHVGEGSRLNQQLELIPASGSAAVD